MNEEALSEAFVAFRIATTEEMEGLRALVDELDLFHRNAIPDIFQKPDQHERTDSIRMLIEGPASDIIVAETDAGPIGLAAVIHKSLARTAVRTAREIVEIDMLVVAFPYRGRGVGKGLLARAERWARDRGVTACELGVWELNVAAIDFYESAGFSTAIRRMSKVLV